MTHLDLFSGIGGFALACAWAGIETIGFVENDSYCQKVLRKHYPGVPIVEDIRDVKKIKEIVANAKGIRWSNHRELADLGEEATEKSRTRHKSTSPFGDSNSARRGSSRADESAILITAGFPCQPFSVAGKRQSKGDDRYLWPETLAVIEAIKPAWILLENVTGIINLALDTVLSDLEGAGYSCETLIIPACAVNAPHRRDRVWIVAYSQGGRCEWGRQNEMGRGWQMADGTERGSQDVSDTKSNGRRPSRNTISDTIQRKNKANLPEIRSRKIPIAYSTEQRLHPEENIGELEGTGGNELDAFKSRSYWRDWWAVEPELGRVAYGIPHRVDRLKCLGNAIVPQVAYRIIKVIADIEGINE